MLGWSALPVCHHEDVFITKVLLRAHSSDSPAFGQRLFVLSLATSCYKQWVVFTGARLLETEKSAKLLREHASEAPISRCRENIWWWTGWTFFHVFSGNIRITMWNNTMENTIIVVNLLFGGVLDLHHHCTHKFPQHYDWNMMLNCFLRRWITPSRLLQDLSKRVKSVARAKRTWQRQR